ncbi:MAG: hypothetical protein ACLP01_25435 [Solirubrobacteraceae bacterium]
MTVEPGVSDVRGDKAANPLVGALAEMSVGSWLSAASGLVLICSLFLAWFTSGLPTSGAAAVFSGALTETGLATPSANAFGASVLLGLTLAVCGALPIALAVVPRRVLPAFARQSRTLFGCAAVATVTILYMRTSPPELLAGGSVINGIGTLVGVGAKEAFGIYLALAAAVGIAAGGMLCESGPLAPATVDTPAGGLRIAIGRARTTGASLALGSLAVAAGVVVLGLIGYVTDIAVLLGLALLGAITTIVMARFARRHAQAAGEDAIVYLTRFGQMSGWAILAVFAVLMVLAILAVGQAVSQVAGY